MTYVFIGLGLTLMAVAYIINVNNAKYLLAGYNTMSDEDRKKVDIDNLVPYIRKFHLFLGISLIVVGVSLTWLFGLLPATLFLAFYPILAYVYFIIDSRKFSRGLNPKWHWVSVIILIATLVFVGYLFFAALREDRLIVEENAIVLEGHYGSEIAAKDIRSVSLVDSLPSIAGKNDGFALGTVLKGHFRTSDGKQVKLILNSTKMPCILITLASGEQIYYASGDVAAETIYDQIRGTFKGVMAE